MAEGESHVTISAAPSPDAISGTDTVTLANEIRLVKSALIYGEKVTLISPTAMFMGLMAEAPGLSKQERLKLLREIGPTLDPTGWPTAAAGLEMLEKLRKKKHREPREIAAVMRFDRISARYLFVGERAVPARGRWRPSLLAPETF